MDVHYPPIDLVVIDGAINNVGGEWYHTYCDLIGVRADRESAKRI